jgi:hypothetical protein
LSREEAGVHCGTTVEQEEESPLVACGDRVENLSQRSTSDALVWFWKRVGLLMTRQERREKSEKRGGGKTLPAILTRDFEITLRISCGSKVVIGNAAEDPEAEVGHGTKLSLSSLSRLLLLLLLPLVLFLIVFLSGETEDEEAPGGCCTISTASEVTQQEKRGPEEEDEDDGELVFMR